MSSLNFCLGHALQCYVCSGDINPWIRIPQCSGPRDLGTLQECSGDNDVCVTYYHYERSDAYAIDYPKDSPKIARGCDKQSEVDYWAGM